jgi:hypothetical protein
MGSFNYFFEHLKILKMELFVRGLSLLKCWLRGQA